MKHYLLLAFALFAATYSQAQLNLTSLAVSKVSCLGNADGTICWSVNNGTAPYYQSINGQFSNSASNCITSVGVGSYTLTISDANNVSVSTIVNMTYAASTAKIFATDTVVCDGDSITLTVNYKVDGPITTSQYCLPTYASPNKQSIKNVIFSSINHTTLCGSVGNPGSIMNKYGEYTHLFTTVTTNSNIVFSLTIDTCGGAGSNSSAVFIDFNADGDFNDPDETAYVSSNNYNGPHLETAIIHMPNNFKRGVTRMRVMNADVAPGGITPCGSYQYGEAQDYTIYLQTAPASISWNSLAFSGIGSNYITTPNLAGSYTVTIDYNNGCFDTAAININNVAAVQATISPYNITCANAALIGGAQTGTAPFSYLWEPGTIANDTITNLATNVYTVEVVDANGCTGTQNYSFISLPLLASNAMVSNVKCYGGNTGTIDWNVSNAVSPVIYQWQPNVSTSYSASNLGVGTYSVTITDANGCSMTSVATLFQPAQALAALTSYTNISSAMATDGKAKAQGSGGTAPYIYKWMPSGEQADSIINKGAGNYTVTVTDFNGCTATNVVIFYKAVPDNISDIAKQYALHISPNPARDILHIQAEKNIGNITLLDMYGKIVFEKTGNAKAYYITTAHLPRGLYILRVDGMVMEKVVLE